MWDWFGGYWFVPTIGKPSDRIYIALFLRSLSLLERKAGQSTRHPLPGGNGLGQAKMIPRQDAGRFLMEIW